MSQELGTQIVLLSKNLGGMEERVSSLDRRLDVQAALGQRNAKRVSSLEHQRGRGRLEAEGLITAKIDAALGKLRGEVRSEVEEMKRAWPSSSADGVSSPRGQGGADVRAETGTRFGLARADATVNEELWQT